MMPIFPYLSDLALELGVEEGLDGGAGELKDKLDRMMSSTTNPTSIEL